MFGRTMMMYAFYVTTSQSGGEGQGDTQAEVGTDRKTNLIGQTGRTMGIETTHLIGLGFRLEKNPIGFMMVKVTYYF